MKKIYYTLIATIALTLGACSESENFNPYKDQNKRSLYPTTITFSNLNNDSSQVEKSWTLAYNNDNSIKNYTYKYYAKTSHDVVINEEHIGKLSYHKDRVTGNDIIMNIITLTSQTTTETTTESYSEKITEMVEISNGTIDKITTLGLRTYPNGTEETISSTRTFAYSNKFCIASTLIDTIGTTTYKYSWSSGKLNSVTKIQEDKSYNITQEEYIYTYNSRDLATDYNFNTMAFIYGNMPEVYAAMNLFGVTSAYKFEGESYHGYRQFAGSQERRPIPPIHRSYTILDNVNSVSYSADSQSSTVYKFTFSNN